MCNLKFLLVTLISSVLINLCHSESFDVNLQWSSVNYTWLSPKDYESAIINDTYVNKNIIISSIRPWKNKVFLTSPRIKTGVPVTLSYVPKTGAFSPNLIPYPNWEMQNINDCKAFQSVKAIEIDTKDRLWVADSGNKDCPPKIIIIDLNTNMVVQKHYFGSSIVNMGNASLNGIAIDGDYAYITDSDERKPGIIVYSSVMDDSWKKIDGRANSSMKAETEHFDFRVELTRVNKTKNINAITISPYSAPERFVYYSALSSYQMYALPTKVLKNKYSNEDVSGDVISVGRMPSPIDAMSMSNYGILYFGLLTDNAVSIWDSGFGLPFTIGQRVIVRNSEILQWPTSFSFDNEGRLWCLSNRMQNFLSDETVKINEINFRAMSMFVNSTSSQYPIPVQNERPTNNKHRGTKNSSAEQGVSTIAHVLLAWILVFLMK